VEAALAGAAARIGGAGGTVAVNSQGAVAAGTVGEAVGDGCTAAVKKGLLGSAVLGARLGLGSGGGGGAAAEVLAGHIAVLRGDPRGSAG
jgi:hypothetical protein